MILDVVGEKAKVIYDEGTKNEKRLTGVVVEKN